MGKFRLGFEIGYEDTDYGSRDYYIPAFDKADVCLFAEACMLRGMYVNVHSQQNFTNIGY